MTKTITAGIKASDLRIGNWLKLGSEETQVFRITYERNLGHCINYPDVPASMFEPIPLTPEWLERAGFEKQKDVKHSGGVFTSNWFQINYVAFEDEPDLRHTIEISINSETKCANIWNITDDEMGASTKHKIEFVHQLQNLYHALTGEELIFNK